MKLISVLFKVFYWPICRVYARHLGDKPADTLLRYLCIPQYWREYNCWPDFLHPRRFTEKVWSRQLYDRDPRLTMVNDKSKVRDYVASKVGNDCLVPLLWYGEHPEEISFKALPEKFVIKINPGCGNNIIISNKYVIDESKIRRQVKKWLTGQDEYLGIAWGYKNIRHAILIESFIEADGKVPVDYKFFCFSGRMEFFKIDFDRFDGHSEIFFDRDLNKLDLVEKGLRKHVGDVVLPDNFQDMIRLAESLSEEFDFMRVDLYSVSNKIYFGELTPYPGGVSAKFEPDSFDYIFGEKWK